MTSQRPKAKVESPACRKFNGGLIQLSEQTSDFDRVSSEWDERPIKGTNYTPNVAHNSSA